MASQAHTIMARKPDDISFIDHSLAQCIRYLASVAKSADTRHPTSVGNWRFQTASVEFGKAGGKGDRSRSSEMEERDEGCGIS